MKSALQLQDMKFTPLPPLDYLLSVFRLDTATGLLEWKARKKGIQHGKPVGSKHRRGYLRVKLDQREYFIHRIVYKMHYGQDPLDMEIDHIDENPTNNRPSNLRLATSSENSQNVSLTKRNKSGIKGVSFNKFRNDWRAFLSCDGTSRNLGSFPTKEAAAQAIQIARELKHKNFANHG